MPVLKFRPERLEGLTGLSLGQIQELLFRLKCETEIAEGMLEVEINPDRPDMYIGEGIARAILGLVGKRLGWRRLDISSEWGEVVNEKPETRPYIAVAVVRNVNIDSEEYLEELIQFQEKLHDTIGRRRRKAAIGFHDLSKLPSRRLRYTMLPIDEAEFTPLGGSKPLSASKILEETEQGVKYGGISLEAGKHPFLMSGDTIIAMPPVINSEYTRVEVGTRDLLIDVTGVDARTVVKVLDIIVGGLSERPGAIVEKVRITTPDGEVWETPEYTTSTWKIDANEASKLLGVPLQAEEQARLLSMMGHNAVVEGGTLRVEPPPYRVDLISWVDFAEDIAIALGYENIGFNTPTVDRPGKLLWETVASRILRDLAVGLGFTEVMQLSLASPKLMEALGYKDVVEVANPVQFEYSVLRPTIISSIVSVLSRNQHARKPVKVFEIGPVIVPGDPPRDRIVMGLGILDNKVGFEDIQAAVYSILRILEVEFHPEPIEMPPLTPGRAARLVGEAGTIAVLGEVRPEVLENLQVEYPMAVAEIDVEVIAEWLSSRTRGQNMGSR